MRKSKGTQDKSTTISYFRYPLTWMFPFNNSGFVHTERSKIIRIYEKVKKSLIFLPLLSRISKDTLVISWLSCLLNT